MFDKKLKDVMTSPVSCLGPHETIKDAASKMSELDIGALVVCEDDGSPVGIVTDRDITVRAIAQGKDPATCRVAEVMSRQVVTCDEEDTTKRAEELMEQHQIRRVVVMGADKKPRGIVALSDLVSIDRGMTGRIVEKVTQPASGFTGH